MDELVSFNTLILRLLFIFTFYTRRQRKHLGVLQLRKAALQTSSEVVRVIF